MAKSKETPSTPPGDDRNLVATSESAAAPDLEEVVQQFWEKNRSLIMGLAVVILVAIIVRNGWEYYQVSQIESAREEFAQADSDAALAAFADDHAGSALAGAALLKVADNAYAEQRYGDAITAYDAAAEDLAGTPFVHRIALGRAMALKMSGDLDGGKGALQNVANDTSAAAAVRGEAIYHLAAMALETEDLAQINDLATQIEAFAPGSTWAQRVTIMRATAEASMGREAVTADAEETSEITFGSP